MGDPQTAHTPVVREGWGFALGDPAAGVGGTAVSGTAIAGTAGAGPTAPRGSAEGRGASRRTFTGAGAGLGEGASAMLGVDSLGIATSAGANENAGASGRCERRAPVSSGEEARPLGEGIDGGGAASAAPCAGMGCAGIPCGGVGETAFDAAGLRRFPQS